MSIRGGWGNAAKFVSVATVICGVLLALPGGSGKRTTPRISSTLRAAGNETANHLSTRDFSRWKEAYSNLSLSFEENQGQSAPEVRFVSHGPGYELFLTPQEAVIALQRSRAWNLSPLHRAQYF